MQRPPVIVQKLVFVVICIACSTMVDAAEPAVAPQEAEIRAASLAYMTALSKADVTSIVGAWTSQGTFVDADGEVHLAREIAQREFAVGEHPQEPSDLSAPATFIRMVTPQVAIEQSKPEEAQSTSNFVAIWVKQDQRWLLDYLREIPTVAILRANPLEELAWMLGRWQTEGTGPQATLEVKWADDRQFLLQDFTVHTPGEDELRVQQRIGWDPSEKVIRSWLFRSDGGFEEGAWSREGDVWVVRKVGVLPGGEKTSTVNFLTHEQPEKCWFKALEVRVGDQNFEDVVLRLSRVPEP